MISHLTLSMKLSHMLCFICMRNNKSNVGSIMGKTILVFCTIILLSLFFNKPVSAAFNPIQLYQANPQPYSFKVNGITNQNKNPYGVEIYSCGDFPGGTSYILNHCVPNQFSLQGSEFWVDNVSAGNKTC